VHRRVAEAIETVHGSRLDDLLPALAHHWAKAGSALAENPRAVDYARRAGDRALAQLAPDEAAGYYQQALELAEITGSPSGVARCELLILLGEAQRLAGNPAHRDTLLRAGRQARELGDSRLLCRAALSNRSGLFSAVGTVDDERVEALEEALAALRTADSPDRARLLAALSIELHFSGSPRRAELVREALAVARRLDNPATTAEGLVALWLATMPVASDERRQLLVELVEIAGAVSDPVLEFYVGLARFLTSLQLGDMTAADDALAACARIAEELGEPVLRWRAAYLRAQRSFVDGQLDAAERLADEALRLGEAAGQSDATGFADFYMVRILQGRMEEAVELARPVAQRFAATKAIVALYAWACAEAGRDDEAQDIVAELRRDDLGALPQDYLWTTTLAMLSRACARLGDRAGAAELYELLRPYHSTIVTAQSVWFGPLAYDLGLLAATLGRTDEADGHFAEAAAIHDRLGVRGMLAPTLLDWARALLRRGGPNDLERAGHLLRRARTTARDLGLTHIEHQSVALLEEARSP
jgi:tetratricopeptide (TPR) repeat protein